MDWFLQADQYVNESINSITYTDTRKTWKVSNKITIGWENVLPLPPANYSETTKNELLYLSKLTTNRTSEQTDLVKLVDDDPGHLFRRVAKKKGLEVPEEISCSGNNLPCFVLLINRQVGERDLPLWSQNLHFL